LQALKAREENTGSAIRKSMVRFSVEEPKSTSTAHARTLKASRSGIQRQSKMMAKPFWKVSTEEAQELIAMCARNLSDMHPFEWHPANKLPDVDTEFDDQKGRKVRRTLLFASLNLLSDSTENNTRGASALDFIEKEVSVADPAVTPAATGSSAPLSPTSAHPALELSGEPEKTEEDLGELLDRFTPRLCWNEIVGQSSDHESEDSDDVDYLMSF